MTEFKTDPRILLDLARDQLRYQLSFYDVIDSKIATLFAAASAVFALLVSVLVVREGEIDRGMVTIVVFAGIPYLLVFAAAAFTHWPRRWGIGPPLDVLYRDIQTRVEADIIRSLIADFAGYSDFNERQMGGWLKPWALRLAGVSLLAETVVLATGLAVLAG